MRLTKSSLLLASMLMAAAISGCGAEATTNNDGNGEAVSATPAPAAGNASGGREPAESSPAPSATEEAAAETVEISVFGSDSELKEMKERKTVVASGTESGLVKSALAEIMKETDDGIVSMWKDIQLLSSKLEEGIVTIDIQIPDESRVGAPAEELMIETMKSTLFQFPFVQGFDILVAGEAAESMMGHVELEHPYVR